MSIVVERDSEKLSCNALDYSAIEVAPSENGKKVNEVTLKDAIKTRYIS